MGGNGIECRACGLLITFLGVLVALFLVFGIIWSASQEDHRHHGYSLDYDKRSSVPRQSSGAVVADILVAKRFLSIEEDNRFVDVEHLSAYHTVNNLIIYTEGSAFRKIYLPPSSQFNRTSHDPIFSGYQPPFSFGIWNLQSHDLVVDKHGEKDQNLLCQGCPFTLPPHRMGSQAHFEVRLLPVIDQKNPHFPYTDSFLVVVSPIFITT